MRAAREAWFEGPLDLDPDALVFIDETAATTAMARRYGRAPRGERCRMAVPQSHWKTTTITAGLRASGVTAPWLLDGAMNGQAFRTYVQSVLSPALRPGDTVVLDNLPAHKVSGIRERIEAAGARLLYLPPLQPGLQPDRASLCEAEHPAAHRGRAHHPGPLGRHQTRADPLPACRMPQLPRRRWIRRNLIGCRSKLDDVPVEAASSSGSGPSPSHRL